MKISKSNSKKSSSPSSSFIWGVGYENNFGWRILSALRTLKIRILIDMRESRSDGKDILGLDWLSVMQNHGIQVIQIPEGSMSEVAKFIPRRICLLSKKPDFMKSKRLRAFRELLRIDPSLTYETLDENDDASLELEIMEEVLGLAVGGYHKPKPKKKKPKTQPTKPIVKPTKDETVTALELWKKSHSKKKKRWRKY